MELEKDNKIELLELVKDIAGMIDIHFIRKKEPKVLGHAIRCAKTFVRNEPSAILLGDDIVYNEERRCLKHLILCFSVQKTTC